MASKQECDRYAAELNEKFEELTRWAISNWPRKDFPLFQSDFAESRREISGILGPKLGDGDDSPSPGQNDKSAPFEDVSPMPWP